MKYAVFSSGGKQYKVAEGDIVELEKLKIEVGGDTIFDQVMLLVEDGNIKVGQPNLAGVTVAAKVLDQIKAKKIRVAKFKAKSRHRKVYGHRQQLTRVQIQTIGTQSNKATKTKREENEKLKTKNKK